jgi:spore coat protein U-like protein
MRDLVGAITCACLLAVSSEAAALCINLKFVGVPSIVTFAGATGGYNVYAPAKHLQTVTFQVQAEATGVTCQYFVALSTGQSGNFNLRKLIQGGKVLSYNVYTDAGTTVLKAPPSAAQNEVISGTFPVVVGLTQTNSHKFFWTIAPQQIVPVQGTHYADANLSLDLYSGTLLTSPTRVASAAVTFRTLVASSVDLSLVRSGAPFNINDTAQLIDFGVLSSGEQREFDLIVRSNNGYAVTMQSENRQVMVHERTPAVADTVSYEVVLNGGAVDLSSGAPVQVLSGTGTTPATGMSFPIEFTVGNLSGAEAAGTYSDVINVTVTAN